MSGWIARIDALSKWVGSVVGWLTVLMIVLGGFNAVARYAGRFVGVRLSSNAYLELQWYLFSAIFLLGGAYALSRGAHVRVDVLYSRYSDRVRAWVDLLGGLVFLLPFVLFSLWVSWAPVRRSWAIREQSPDPGGLVRYPIKALILVGFFLLLIQGVGEILKALEVLRAAKSGASERDLAGTAEEGSSAG